MTDTMIERMARALCQVAGKEPSQRIIVGEERATDRHVIFTKYNWETFVVSARAVLTAMREPTEAMVENGVDYTADHAPADAAVLQWRSWIDVALAEGE